MRSGQLVVATPVLEDPNFSRTVVLLLQADEQDGALGLVLNRPSGTGVDEVLPAWVELAADPPGTPASSAYAAVRGPPRRP